MMKKTILTITMAYMAQSSIAAEPGIIVPERYVTGGHSYNEGLARGGTGYTEVTGNYNVNTDYTEFRIFDGSTTIFKQSNVRDQTFYMEDDAYNMYFNETPYDNNSNASANINTFHFGSNTVVNSSFAPFLMINSRGTIGTRSVGSLTINNGTFHAGSSSAGVYMQLGQNLTINNASFYAGTSNVDQPTSGVTANLQGNMVINNQTDDETGRGKDEFIAADFKSNASNIDNSEDFTGYAYLTGGDGLTATATGTVTINGGDFIASTAHVNRHSATATGQNMYNAWAYATGGRGAFISASSATIKSGYFKGGAGGYATVQGEDSNADGRGGSGITAQNSINILDGTFIGAAAGSATSIRGQVYDAETDTWSDSSDAGALVTAMGGSGILLTSGTSTINVREATGAKGGRASAKDDSTVATATGGSGIMGLGASMTINGGIFTGSKGGAATGGTTDATGGAGARAVNGSLTITGGEFIGGEGGTANGVAERGNVGVWVSEANLTINENTTNTLIHGDVVFNNDSAKTVKITGGTIEGDLLSLGSGTTALSISENASYGGTFTQKAGIVNVALSDSNESKFFSDVQTGGELNFTGAAVLTTPNSVFNLTSTNSLLSFGGGAELSAGTQIKVNSGLLKSTGNLTLQNDSSLAFDYSTSSDNGALQFQSATDQLMISSNSNAKIYLTGAALTPSGTVTIVSGGAASDFAGYANLDVVKPNIGWLTKVDEDDIDTSTGLVITHTYNSLTNSSLKDINAATLSTFDTMLQDETNRAYFVGLNIQNEATGAQQVRFAASQTADTVDATLSMQQQLTDQFVDRSDSFRGVNGFVSTAKSSPYGAAGPKEGTTGLRGFAKAYGGTSERDAGDNYSAYDSSSWGTVIGLDYSLENVLIGLAGGYGSADVEAGAYNSDLKTTTASGYATFGNADFYVDIIGTYAWNDTDVTQTSGMTTESYDSSSISGYIGAGKRFETGALALTPTLSMLATYYDQDAYTRNIMNSQDIVNAYDETSYLGSIGAKIAPKKQIDWTNAGLQFVPELRLSWLHEFNPDLDSLSTEGGAELLVRAREEDMLKVGLGFDLWNWRYLNTKLELDYDGLFGDTTTSHTFSGKISHQF